MELDLDLSRAQVLFQFALHELAQLQMRRQLGPLRSTCHQLGSPLCVAGSIAPGFSDGAALSMPPSIPLPHVSAQLVKDRCRSSTEPPSYQPDRIATLHAAVDLLSLG